VSECVLTVVAETVTNVFAAKALHSLNDFAELN